MFGFYFARTRAFTSLHIACPLPHSVFHTLLCSFPCSPSMSHMLLCSFPHSPSVPHYSPLSHTPAETRLLNKPLRSCTCSAGLGVLRRSLVVCRLALEVLFCFNQLVFTILGDSALFGLNTKHWTNTDPKREETD